MSPEPACREARALLPELALGIAAGDERSRALDHVAGCAACRALLGELSMAADELLLLAPAREPPAGFESRVLQRGAGSPPRPRRWVAAVLAAAVVVGASAAAAAILVTTQEERELGARYRKALAVADGSYFGAVPLESESGARVGHVFAYEGSRPWVFVVLSGLSRSGRFAVTLETRDGDRLRLGAMTVRGGSGSWGTTLPVELHDVSGLELRGHGRVVVASL
jgi:hypothetical protein